MHESLADSSFLIETYNALKHYKYDHIIVCAGKNHISKVNMLLRSLKPIIKHEFEIDKYSYFTSKYLQTLFDACITDDGLMQKLQNHCLIIFNKKFVILSSIITIGLYYWLK